MKYFHLIWSALFRRKTRTVFTLLSVLAAFLLFGLLEIGVINYAFNALGLPPHTAFLALMASLIGSYLNIPITRIEGGEPGVSLSYGARFDHRQRSRAGGISPAREEVARFVRGH